MNKVKGRLSVGAAVAACLICVLVLGVPSAESAESQRAFLNTRLGQVHYVTEGVGDPVILLHQTPLSLDQYAEIIPLLVQGNKWVIAMDNLGFGDSDKPSELPSVEEYGAIVVQLMDELNISKASIIGSHTGSFVGIELATAYPDRVEKLVLFEPYYIDDAVRANIREYIAKDFKPFEMSEDGSHLAQRWQSMRKGSPNAPLEVINRSLIDNLKSGKGAGAGRTLVLNYPMEKRLPLIQAPAFIIWGNHPLPGFPEEDKVKVGEAIPRNKVLNYEGKVDLRLLADEFAPKILSFLESSEI